jgi:sigma-54 dependent transcriptional regulator, acetoin dehydrogenase operon transcriptional activator AcoR
MKHVGAHRPVPPERQGLAEQVGKSDALGASWERSMRHGLRRTDRAVFNDLPTKSQARRISEEHRGCIALAAPELSRLYKTLGSASWGVLYMNARGQVVHAVGDPASSPRELRVIMQPGRQFTEAQIGTTAPGCVLATGTHVSVDRGQHYLLELKHFFCSSAPVLGPDGNLAGIVDVSGIDVHPLPLVSEMVALAARRIENGMVLAMRECVHLRFHCDERLLGTPFEGIMAVDPGGTISGANQAARRMLSTTENSLIGRPIESLVNEDLAIVLHVLGTGLRPHGRSFLLSESSSKPVRRVALSHAFDQLPGQIQRPRVFADPAFIAQVDKAMAVFNEGMPIMVAGETGTGKETFARAVHADSGSSGPFVVLDIEQLAAGAVDCQFPRKSFVGQPDGVNQETGLLANSTFGVLFINEICELPVASQKMLANLLEHRCDRDGVTFPGSTVKYRIVCGTCHDLDERRGRRKLISELLYRVNALPLKLTPLRERQDRDEVIDCVLQYWFSMSSDRIRCWSLKDRILPEALARLYHYAWPGNLRELEQIARTLGVAQQGGHLITVSDLPPHITSAAARTGHDAEFPLLDAVQMNAIREAMRESSGNISSAARNLGISRNTLYSWLRRGA